MEKKKNALLRIAEFARKSLFTRDDVLILLGLKREKSNVEESDSDSSATKEKEELKKNTI